MDAPPAHEVTGLLQAWSAGNQEALQKLTPLVYRELHRAARHYMAGERTAHTLQATALINEVYLRLIDARRMDWQNRAHFFGVCAQLMRRILTDFARSRRYQKGGGGAPAWPFHEGLMVGSRPQTVLFQLGSALKGRG